MGRLLKLLILLITIIQSQPGVAYFITVDAYAEDCFFEKVQDGSKLGLTFEVIEGGFLDIDVRVFGPQDEDIITRERESNGKITFAANKTGKYTYCFSNKMSTMTPKKVKFSMFVSYKAPPASSAAKQGNGESESTKLETMLKELNTALIGIKHEQEYMEIREKIHRRINESTNFRVLLWSIFEAIVIVGMTIGQVYYLKSFFEVRRMV